MMFKDIQEAEEIFKEEALEKIAKLVKYHKLTHSDILSVFDDLPCMKKAIDDMPPSKSFDPFFDAW